MCFRTWAILQRLTSVLWGNCIGAYLAPILRNQVQSAILAVVLAKCVDNAFFGQTDQRQRLCLLLCMPGTQIGAAFLFIG